MPLADLTKELLDAARLGRTETVQFLLLHGALFTSDWLGNSALHYAAQNGHVQLCDVLIRAGISLDARTKVSRTPLHLAAEHGHVPVMQLLISSGADVHATDMIGMTALHWAVQKSHADIVCLLMQHGANASSPNKFGKTSLDIAVDTGRHDITLLIQQLSSVVSTELNNAAVEEVTTTEMTVNTDVPNIAVTVPNVTIAVPSQLTGPSVASSIASSSNTVTTSGNNTLSPSEGLVRLASLAEVNNRCRSRKPGSVCEALRWLKTHGTVVDNTSFVTSMLNSGQTVVLTEAGKLLMKDVRRVTGIAQCLNETHKTKNSDETDNHTSEDDTEEPLPKKSKSTEDTAECDGSQTTVLYDNKFQ